MKGKKSLYTMCFEIHKQHGLVEKRGKCRFVDGRTRVERTLWYDKQSNEYVVMLNGNAHGFRPWKKDGDGIMHGFI